MSIEGLTRMREHLGEFYRWGGQKWGSGVDCSGAVLLCEGWTGPDLTAEDIRRNGRPVARGDERPGDFVLLLRAGRAFHVVYFLGWEKDKRGVRALVVGASGGDSTTKTAADAKRRNACVRYDLYNLESKSVEVRRWM